MIDNYQANQLQSNLWTKYLFLRANNGLFFVYFCLFKQTLQILQQIWMWKMSIQYPALGFELTTFWLQVSSINH